MGNRAKPPDERRVPETPEDGGTDQDGSSDFFEEAEGALRETHTSYARQASLTRNALLDALLLNCLDMIEHLQRTGDVPSSESELFKFEDIKRRVAIIQECFFQLGLSDAD